MALGSGNGKIRDSRKGRLHGRMAESRFGRIKRDRAVSSLRLPGSRDLRLTNLLCFG